MQSYRNHLTMRDGGKDATQTSSSHQPALEPIPHSQHQPFCVRVQPVAVTHSAPFRIRHFNLKRVDWNSYAAELDTLIDDVESRPEKPQPVHKRYCLWNQINIYQGGCNTRYIRSIQEALYK